ncbi:PH domain-containing protein [Oscillochloris sp. ZM17-4]|uniref:PH domain-containing protein n=1 Tax=Oscillochloris sp. ZM17-4 TaxID=2866714 RepID=UPI001C73C5C1|nr:PH domain-containing protein [Oscillochloris sp. ZM17-4]MBX0329875.1 PH domain-containing protein [Oscillochloris sp. ZM17-4]
MRFEVAPLDEYARRITVGLAYLGGLLMLPLLFAYLANLRWGGLLIPPALALPLALFLLLSYAFQPGAYLIEDDTLVVRRRWWRPLRIPLDMITGASAATVLADVPRRGLRFAFNPGVFGYLGPFHLEPYGETFFLATDRSRLVSVARAGSPPLIISPARPRQFVEALNERRSQAALDELSTIPGGGLGAEGPRDDYIFG